MSDISLTLIKAATQASDPVADSAAFPANVGDTDRYVEAGQMRVSLVHTSIATETVTQSRVQTLVLNNNAADIVITLDGTVAAGNYLEILALDTFGAGSGHTVKLPAGVTYDGTNNTATFDADLEKLYCRAITATRFFVDNPDSVAFTST